MQRYQRHISLNEIGLLGQIKLSKAKVLVVGAGGLGIPALLNLTGAGIGKIGIVDFDTVSLSNLQRQWLYRESDIGFNKAEVCVDLLKERNSEIELESFTEGLHLNNALEIISHYDIVLDGTDNFRTRYLINDACVQLNKPFVFGALYKFEGQVSVFNFKNGPTYRCLFPKPPLKGEVPNCSEAGVLGTLPTIIGTLQANEVIKIILGLGGNLSAKLLLINILNHTHKLVSFSKKEVEINKIKKSKLSYIPLKDCDLNDERKN
jgi:adenylyltransferase/sulfurtransferase